ncbi:MAG: hypothetical protein E7306_14445 [Butyrivibrio sp.]|nr:hypothetical protein [Butyrivibrio sp.]
MDHITKNVYKTLIDGKIDIFRKTYSESADELFKEYEHGTILHPGEYGMYRERALHQLLKTILSKDFSVGDGFLINSKGEISTQCDVVIYNSAIDGVTLDGVAKYYPIEEVFAIGEVKSTLDRASLKKALRKLAQNKMMTFGREDFTNNKVSIITDCILPASFLVCKSIRDINTLDDNYFDDVYEGGPLKARHNIILSLDEACLSYRLTLGEVLGNGCEEETSWPHAFINENKLIPKTIYAEGMPRNFHVYIFLGSLRNAIETIEKVEFPFLEYLGVRNEKFDETLRKARESTGI